MPTVNCCVVWVVLILRFFFLWEELLLAVMLRIPNDAPWCEITCANVNSNAKHLTQEFVVFIDS